ncbi:MAG: hypothetical protein J0L63_11330 [Anaerolineae bacterium]|nr:hypothetical protein [Anaerolineae bacterium]MBN8619490.1 hypothetical protein [Anaerolineae bacterium]
MSFKVDWNQQGKVLQVTMSGSISMQEFIEIDRQINEYLQASTERIALIVDASDAVFSPYSIERVKPTQHYLNSYQISQLVVVSKTKLNRLAILLLFNLCRPKLQFCNDPDQAQRFISMARA